MSPRANYQHELTILNSTNPAAALIELGNQYQTIDNAQAARLSYERALQWQSGSEIALRNLGYLLSSEGEHEQAVDVYDRLLAVSNQPLDHLLAASVLPVVADSTQEIDFYRERQWQIYHQMLERGLIANATQTLVPNAFYLSYHGRNNKHVMQLRGKLIRGGTFQTVGKGKRAKPRVGYISAYFRDHTIGRLNIGHIENRNPSLHEVFVIDAGGAGDWMTDRFRESADHFIELPNHLPSAIARLRSLELDVLIFTDVGMDSLVSTLAFSRFAPCQIATWGHPITTGSSAIDVFLSSNYLEVAGAEDHYTERLVKLDSLGITYQLPASPSEPDRTSFCERNNIPTDCNLYVCPQTLFKFHPDFDSVLSRILTLDEKAILVGIHARAAAWNRILIRRLRRANIDIENRVRFLPSMANREYLALLKLADVVLDPVHFSGGNSSLETLAMGTPLVTQPGEFLCSRITAGLYDVLGIKDCLASSPTEYVDIAVRIGTDKSFRARVISQIKQQQAFLAEHLKNSTEWDSVISMLSAHHDW